MRRVHVKPDWLDSLLLAWAARQSAEITHGLGYDRTSPMFKARIGRSGYAGSEPFGITLQDLSDVGFEISDLDSKHRLAIYRAYLPWTRQTMAEQYAVYLVSDRTWINWAQDAAWLLVPHLERKPLAEISNFR